MTLIVPDPVAGSQAPPADVTTFAVKNLNNPGCHRNASSAHDAARG